MIKPFFLPWNYGLRDYCKHPLKYSQWTIEHFFENIREVYRWLRNLVIRGLYGYCRRDTWGFDYYLADVIVGGLKILKKEKHGHPCDCHKHDFTEECKCAEKWDEALDEMIEGFEAAKRVGEDEYFKTISPDFPNKDATRKEVRQWIKASEEDQKLFKKKMKVFIDNFFHLWD
jgi:hypothetical protein